MSAGMTFDGTERTDLNPLKNKLFQMGSSVNRNGPSVRLQCEVQVPTDAVEGPQFGGRRARTVGDGRAVLVVRRLQL